jgi:hypothetical protein
MRKTDTSAKLQHPDDAAVDRFSAAMKAKLKDARENKGRGGWDDPSRCSDDFLASALVRHAYKSNPGTYEDIANFCMMLHQRGVDPSIMRQANNDFDEELKQEAFNEGIEAAIAACDDCYITPDNDREEGQHDGVSSCIDAIRALKKGGDA